jgi:glycosyltransferase involved in cell wall biosynthesis
VALASDAGAVIMGPLESKNMAGFSSSRTKRVLFLQVVEPGMYPPIIAASHLMAEAGWDVTILASPSADSQLRTPSHPSILMRRIAERPSFAVRKSDFMRYMAAAAVLALRWRPDIVYASDWLGAVPGLLAARLAGAHLVYHEHDSPSPGVLRLWLAKFRAQVAKNADLVIFPNAERAEIVRREIGFPAERLRIVWNLPRRAEQPTLVPKADVPLVLWYHGSITPDRLPTTIIDAIASFGGRVRLQIAGYEAPLAHGYIPYLLDLAARENGDSFVSYIGQIKREDLLARASAAHVGLAFMPPGSNDINMRHMTGASNKAFDYMAAGLALLVSDLPDWLDMFVAPGYARACDPRSSHSIACALGWFLDHPEALRKMAGDARVKIAAEWNYETQFAPILAGLSLVHEV